MGERAASFLDPQLVLARLADSQCAFNAEYENTFGLVVSSDCPPYETEYIDSKFAFQRSNALADISGFYHAFGLAIADTHAERADHVALELEFMATLLSLERHAADGDFRERRLTVCREAQARFLMDHLAWWIPLFSALLAREHRGGFYEAVAVFLSALIPAERALLNVDVQSPPGSPDPQQQPDGCDGCPLAM
jgi:TorA maturation chaperone TorD